jgi:hypothetical protein
MLLPIAPALDRNVSDVELQPVPLRALAIKLFLSAIVVAEFVALRFHVVPGARSVMDGILFGIGLGAVLSTLSAVPSMRWFREPVGPEFKNSRTRRWTAALAVETFVCLTWILRDFPPVLWIVALFVAPFVLEAVIRGIGQRLRGDRSAVTSRIS